MRSVLVSVPSQSSFRACSPAPSRPLATSRGSPRASSSTWSQGIMMDHASVLQRAHVPLAGSGPGPATRSKSPSKRGPEVRNFVQSQAFAGSWYAGMGQTGQAPSVGQSNGAAPSQQPTRAKPGRPNSWYLSSSLVAAAQPPPPPVPGTRGGGAPEGLTLDDANSNDRYDQVRQEYLAALMDPRLEFKDPRCAVMESVYKPIPGAKSGAQSTSLNDYITYGRNVLGDLARKLGV